MILPALAFVRSRGNKLENLLGRKVMYCYANKNNPVTGTVVSIGYSPYHVQPESGAQVTVALQDGTHFKRSIKSWMVIK